MLARKVPVKISLLNEDGMSIRAVSMAVAMRVGSAL